MQDKFIYQKKDFVNCGVPEGSFGRLIKNTLVLSGLNLLFGFTAPILFALLLDQLRNLRYKKVVQTASYMPYFISWVVVAGMALSFVDSDGIVTKLLVFLGYEKQNYDSLIIEEAFAMSIYKHCVRHQNGGCQNETYDAGTHSDKKALNRRIFQEIFDKS